jgi:chromosome partition protein MukB
VLARLAGRDGLLGRGHELEREHQDAARLASRQDAARALGAQLGLDARLGTAPATALVAGELDAAEQTVREAEDEVRNDPAAELRPRIAALRARLAALDDRLSAWHRAAAAATRLAGFAPAPASRAEATALRDRLLEAQHALAARRTEREAARERTRLRAIALERAGAAVDPELLRLRDELGGELLAERFEDLDVAAAGWVEARLGPLVDALIVDDPAGVAQRLASLPRQAPTVYLVAAGAALDVAADDVGAPATPQLALLQAEVGTGGAPGGVARRGDATRAGTHVGPDGSEVDAGKAAGASQAAEAGTHVGAVEAGADAAAGASQAVGAGTHVGAGGAVEAGADAAAGASQAAGAGTHVGAGGTGSGAIDAHGEGTASPKVTADADAGGWVAGEPGGAVPRSAAIHVDQDGQIEARTETRAVTGASGVGAGGDPDPPRKGRKDRAGGSRSAAPAAPAEDPQPVDVVCVEPFGVRVTRRPDPPSLGRRARERQVAELHAELARDADALDELAGEAARLAAWRRDADDLVAQLDAWLAGDPAGERGALESELAAAELALLACDDRRRAAQARAAEARRRRDGLRRLLGDAALLDPPDHAARAAELSALRGELATARGELERAAPHRRVLAELVDILRRPPLDDDRRAAATARAGELAGELDRLFLARGALEDVLAHRHAAAWGDAEQALAAEASLAPALERQHADARAATQVAEQAEAAADAAWEAATTAALEADARCAAATAHRERAAAELAALGGPITGAAGDHDRLVAAAIEHVNAIEAELRGLVTAAALAAERRDQAARAAADARARLASETRDAGPTAAAWAELRTTADAAGLLSPALAAAPAAGRTSIQLTADAWSKREVLLDRVTRARGGAELGDAIRALALDGPSYLRAWQLTREWLRHRVPAQVVEVDEPLAALERLRSHLDVLEARLARQEHDLRGTSEDVARGIDVQLRRASGQIRRLNQHLDGIQFGSVRGIRIELRRIDRMEQILRALRIGEAQELLFLSAIPIEEALDEIFRRYGGGGRGGGERLLDYREYLELAVQIRRQAAADWETASPTRLSTGEAIGVGAAVMMVVLTEWERDANLLRARRTTGSLRFLFLDEANRLSRDNLGVLFDLCKTLDLQLLIAAPEVARAEGNTTYRLIRHVTDDGREEVIVSGRRAAGAAPQPADGA